MLAINEQQLKRLEWLLERPLAQEEGSCPSFDRLSELQHRDLAKLAVPGTVLDAILYVRFLMTPPASLRNATSFVDQVVRQNMSVSYWIANHFHRG